MKRPERSFVTEKPVLGTPLRSAARGRLALGLIVFAFAASCGAGTAGVVAATDDGGTGSTDQVTVVGGLTADATKASPAEIRFRLTDPDASDVADVEIRYSLDGTLQSSVLIARLIGLATAAAPGFEHRFDWDFVAALGSERFQALTLFVLRVGSTAATPGQNALLTSVGNDPPALNLVPGQFPAPDQELASAIPVNFTVADIASERVRIRIEVNSTPGFPASGWSAARPSGLVASAPTPEFAFDSTTALALGTGLTFAWDSSFDLGGQDVAAKLRFQALELEEPSAASPSVETPQLRIDNNLPPSVQLDIAEFLLNDDAQRTVPISLDIADPESDSVQLVLQWRRQGQEYPPLPQDLDTLASVLADPLQRRRAQIATEQPIEFAGRLLATGDDSIARMPDMAFATLQLATTRGTPQSSLVGRTLEVLRASRAPTAVSDGWSGTTLNGPVAVLGRDSGAGVLVLESQGNAWRVRELDPTTGIALGFEAGGPGAPTALAWITEGSSFLVASQQMGDWTVFRVERASGTVTTLFDNAGRVTPGAVRGLTSLTGDSFAACVADAVVSVHRASTGETLATIVMDSTSGPLVEPRALVKAPEDDQRVYVADSFRDRIYELDLRSHAIHPVPGADVIVPDPLALALESPGNRLLVLGDAGGSGRLLALALRRNPDADGDGRSEPQIVELATGLPRGSSLAVADDGFIALVDPLTNRLFAGGGVEQVRTIVAYETTRQEARVATPFSPPLGAGRTWRIRDRVNPVPPGSRATFVWDTRDVFGGGPVLVRAFAFDRDRGPVSTEAPKRLVPPAGAPSSSGARNLPHLIFADIDEDGDVDEIEPLATSTLVRQQTLPGEYGLAQTLLGSDRVVQVLDIDADGRADLLGENAVHFQSAGAPGTFPQSLGLGERVGLAAGDMDRDGLPDLVVGDSQGWFLLRQSAFRAFTQIFADTFGDGFGLVREVRLADLDLDGLLDLVLEGPPFLSVSLQVAPGQPGAATLLLERFSSCPFREVDTIDFQVLDLARDGRLDVVATLGAVPCSDLGIFGSTIRIFEDVGFTARTQVIGSTAATPALGRVRAEDLNHDGRLDLLVESADNVMVFSREEGAPFTRSSFLAGFDGVDQLPPPVDPDGDGFRDPAHRLGSWADSSEGPLGTGGVGGYSSSNAADLDRDGKLDLRGGIRGLEDVELFTQGPISRFGPDFATFVGIFMNSEARFLAGDFNGDGFLDGASVGLFPPGLLHTLNCGRSQNQGCDLPNNFGQLLAADLDGDGDLDLVNSGMSLGSFFPPGLYVMVNDGSRIDVNQVLGDSNDSFLLADIEPDGDLDLVQATGSGFQFFVQTAPLQFELQPMTGVAATSVSGGIDLDCNGSLDFLLQQGNQTNLWSLRDSTLAFDQTLGFRSGMMLDLDRDGLLDFLVESPEGLGAALQTAPGVFVREPFSSSGGFLQVLGDLNGDGDLDGIRFVFDNRIQVVFGGR